ncbi:MAG: cytochrome c [Rubrivivax sp.]|nr:cytochrome c [Rubrivivax sp.]
MHHGQRQDSWRTAVTATVGLWLALAAAAAQPDISRQQQLVRLVRQDCGSCHGMKLTGGLGPALTREALADRTVDTLASTIFHGRPGTPMPPWRDMLSADDATWIAERLLAGFPQEAR